MNPTSHNSPSVFWSSRTEGFARTIQFSVDPGQVKCLRLCRRSKTETGHLLSSPYVPDCFAGWTGTVERGSQPFQSLLLSVLNDLVSRRVHFLSPLECPHLKCPNSVSTSEIPSNSSNG